MATDADGEGLTLWTSWTFLETLKETQMSRYISSSGWCTARAVDKTSTTSTTPTTTHDTGIPHG